jgi:hypothetical protein
VKPESTPKRLVHKKTWGDSLPIDMFPFAVTIPAIVPQMSEIPKGLLNYPVQGITDITDAKGKLSAMNDYE